MTVIARGQAGEFSSPSIASTPEGDIRWHAYVRLESGGTNFGVYVQREVSIPGAGGLGTFESEVRVTSGERARVAFLNAQWQLAYVWNGNAFVIQFDRNEAPSVVPPPTGQDLVDYFQVQGETASMQSPARRDYRRQGIASLNQLGPTWTGAALPRIPLPYIRGDDVAFVPVDTGVHILYRNVGNQLTEVSRRTVPRDAGRALIDPYPDLQFFPYTVGEQGALWLIAPVKKGIPDWRGPVVDSRGLIQLGTLRVNSGIGPVSVQRVFLGSQTIIITEAPFIVRAGSTRVRQSKVFFQPVTLVGMQSSMSVDSGQSRPRVSIVGSDRIIV